MPTHHPAPSLACLIDSPPTRLSPAPGKHLVVGLSPPAQEGGVWRGGSEQLCHSYFPRAPAASRSSSTNRFFPSLDQPGSSSAWDVVPNCCQAVTGRPCPVWLQQMSAHPLQEEGLGTAQPASSLVILDSVSRNPQSRRSLPSNSLSPA